MGLTDGIAFDSISPPRCKSGKTRLSSIRLESRRYEVEQWYSMERDGPW